MTSQPSQGKIPNFSIEKYSDFKTDIKQILNDLANLKNFEHDDEIKNLLTLTKENERDLFYEYLFFTNYSRMVPQDNDWNLHKNNKLIDDLDKLKLYNESNGFSKNSFRLIFHMYLYLLIHIEKNISFIVIYPDDDYRFKKENLAKKKELNQLYHLLNQILIMIFKLYKSKIYSLKHMLILVDSISLFVKQNSISEDKYINLKNIILFDLLFEFLGNVAKIILNNKPVAKNDLSLFFDYFIKYIQSEDLQTYFNFLILSKCEALHKLISIILNNLDYNENIDIYNKHKNEIVNFFADIYRNNASRGNLFELLINQNKNSFVNLMNYQKRKDSIINDIYCQNLYIQILRKLFSNESLIIPPKNKKFYVNPLENSFLFNGSNSKMVFRLNKISLENSILFFSFQLSNELTKDTNSDGIIPLIIIQSASSSDTTFRIYLQKENNAYKLKFCHEKFIDKKPLNPITVNFDKIKEIETNINYYLALKFIGKKIVLHICRKDTTENYCIMEEKDKYEFNFVSTLFKIGHDDTKNLYFKGFIGSIIIINNLKLKKHSNYEEVIKNILNLDNYYKLLPYILNKSSEYNFNNYFYFTKIDKENTIKSTIDLIIKDIEDFNCSLYLTPEILNTYDSLLSRIQGLTLPEIPYITFHQNYHIINFINIYMTKINSTFIEFQKNNGFDYLNLIYEYYYQLFTLMMPRSNPQDNFSNPNPETLSTPTSKSESIINLNNSEIENAIVNTFIDISFILKYYNDYKIITNNMKSFKTLFRNLFETLKKINKISNKIIEKISNSIHSLILDYKNVSIELEKLINIKGVNDINVISQRDKLLPFVDGLIDMIFNTEFYENYNGENYINSLFRSIETFFINYLLDNAELKILPFKPDFLYKLLNFVKVFEKSLNNEENKNNKIFESFFDLLGSFYKTIIKENNSSIYFRKLIPFSVVYYGNNLFIAYKFLNFINEMSYSKYSIEKYEDIKLLDDYAKNLNKNEGETNDKILIDEINYVILCIILKSYLFHIEDKSIFEIGNIIESYIKSEKAFINIVGELKKIISKILANGISGFKISNQDNNNNKKEFNYGELFKNIFNFIKILFSNTILESEVENNGNEIKEDSTKNKFKALFNLLTDIYDILKTNSNNKISKYNIHCIINYIKFFHYVIFNEVKIFELCNKVFFIELMLQIILICPEYCILNSNQLFEIEKDNIKEKKTIIEIVFELYMEYILNENSPEYGFKLLLKFTEIFYDDQFQNEKKSIFYVNDYLRYLLSQKKIKEKNENVLNKYNTMKKNNENSFKIEEKFEMNFTTYFLTIILDYQKKISEKKNLNENLKEKLNKFIEILFSDILKDIKNLYNIDKKFFSKSGSSNEYNEKVNYLNKYMKKEQPVDEVKSNLSLIVEKIRQKNEKKEENIKEENMQQMARDREKERETIHQVEVKDKAPDKKIEVYDNTTFKFPTNINTITFFYDLDENYTTNVKKDYMNNIFGLYYIDEFFYNSDFCIMKKYYINFINKGKMIKNSKQLNFPSTLKNYKNNLESSIFVKQFNNYFSDLFLTITHDYVDRNLNDKLARKKSIKLKEKDLPEFVGDKVIECELLKNESTFYGKLEYNEKGNYFMFKEEFKEYDGEDKDFKYLFLIDNFWYFSNIKKEKSKKFREKTKKKNILIIFDNIEEIIEMRILLLWKAFEIHIKNGKSYLFNFLSTSDYDKFIKDFLLKSKLKNVFRKRDFITDKSAFSEGWINGLISNQEYLLLLNRYSSRSYNDPTQYYIFPWLLSSYKELNTFNKYEKLFHESLKEEARDEYLDNNKLSIGGQYSTMLERIKQQDFGFVEKKLKHNEKNKLFNNEELNLIIKEIKKIVKDKIRNFSYPISLQSPEKREIAKKKYLEDKEDGVKFPQHSGCHYSNSAYIYFYLMRQQPYDNLIVRLQEYSLENTNRCFINLTTLQSLAIGGNDNRELIPEFFTKMDYFLNVNCDFYGILDVKKVNLDDSEVDIFDDRDSLSLPTYVYFILQHKKLLNSKSIGFHLNKWIDNIFGVNQIPEKLQIESCNIFPKYTYEQKVNLEKKLEKNKAKDLTPKQIVKKLTLSISQLINFGITPAQLFKNAHGQFKINNIKPRENRQENDEKMNQLEEDFEEELDVETALDSIKKETINCKISPVGIPQYFVINPTINKIFVYNGQEKLIIFNSELFNRINMNYTEIRELKYYPENLYIYTTQENQNYQIKYGFSSFNKEIKYKSNDSKDETKFHTYYYDKINYILNKKNILLPKNDIEKFMILTCRHLDSTFQIHYLKHYPKQKKKEMEEKVFSFFCEDFITACCCVSSDNFILGLMNGKLLEYKMQIELLKPEKKKKVEPKEKINIKNTKYIQAHKGKINSIDIDERLGIVITSGDDNYILIRKLYDFELLLPIKIKNKFAILMTKVSPYNFFYVLCFNKQNQKNIIFGYTLSGIKFAKSEYGIYDNISINEDGNIYTTYTVSDKKELIILSGCDLTRLNQSSNQNHTDLLSKINIVNWSQYDCFYRMDEEDMRKIITYIWKDGDSYYINTKSLSDL